MIGDIVIYLITFDLKIKIFKFFSVLKLEDMEGILLRSEELENIQSRFKNHIDNLSDDEVLVEKEKLCYLIQLESKRIDTSIDKMNIYTTIILTVLPLILALVDLKMIFTFSVQLKIISMMIVYSILNVCIYIFRAIKVRGISTSTFRDLRDSEKKDKTLLLQYQYDWQNIKYKAQLFVSFILNLQDWIILSIFLSIVLSVSISIESNTIKTFESKIDSNQIITITEKNICIPYSESAVQWQDLISNIEKKKVQKIYFILNRNTNTLSINNLDKYNSLDIRMIVDDSIKIGDIKIIQEE